MNAIAPIAILTVIRRDEHDSKKPMLLTITRDRVVHLASASGIPLALSNIANAANGYGAAQVEAALAACDTQGEALFICEKMLPRYISGPRANQSFYIVKPWNPRELIDMAHEDKRQIAEQFGVEHKRERGKPWRAPDMAVIYQMAAEGRPVDDDDWGSDRQIEAQNAFFNAIDEWIDTQELYATAKMGVDDMIDDALERMESVALTYKIKAEERADGTAAVVFKDGSSKEIGRFVPSDNPGMAKTHVLYMSDGEQTTFLPLGDLISNFDTNGGWHDRCNAEDMRDEIFGRGWYEGTHECGRYLVVAVDKIKGASNLSRYFAP